MLDTLLVDAAEASGVEVRFGVTVDGLCVDTEGRVAGIAARDASGERFEAAARFTVGADGIRSVVRWAPARRCSIAAPVERGGLRLLRRRGPAHRVCSYRTGATAGFIPTNDGQVCVWAGGPSARFLAELRHRRTWAFPHARRGRARAVERVQAARLVGRLHGFAGEVSYLRQPWGPGWALVGDASHFKDPIAAHGITDALRDAELLARAVLRPADLPAPRLRAARGTRCRCRCWRSPTGSSAYRWDLA